MTIDPLDLTSRLIACPSVTPIDAGALDVAADALRSSGFSVHRFASGEHDGERPIENLVALRGSGAPHFAFAGHTDVVPPGPDWPDAFCPRVVENQLVGRGAVDMKGAVASFIAAASRLRSDHPGTISVLLTGDEEGRAIHGTAAILGWLAERAIRPDMCLVGEPTSERQLGDTVKIGRRGSVNIRISVRGVQGHVAYPQLADNPLPKLVRALARLAGERLDEGTAWFEPSNLELTEIDATNPASNVTPAHVSARLNIRFNDAQRGHALAERVRAAVLAEAPDADVEAAITGEAFLTEPGPFSSLVIGCIEAELGLTPALSTGGGTSDARFLSQLCPTLEFGLLNTTMHKVGEAVPIADLTRLTTVYQRIAQRAIGAG